MPVRAAFPLLSRRLLLPAAVAAVAAFAALPGSATAKRSTCADRASVTLDASPQVRLYSVRHNLYACAYANGRRYRLDRVAHRVFGAIGDPVVAGRYVAFTRGVEGIDHRTETVYVRDVRRGRWLHRNVAAVVAEAGFARGEGAEINSIVLDSAGRVAWIVDHAIAPGGVLRSQVVRLGRDSGPELLDAATATPESDPIDSSSLAITERYARARIFWMHGETARTALMR